MSFGVMLKWPFAGVLVFVLVGCSFFSPNVKSSSQEPTIVSASQTPTNVPMQVTSTFLPPYIHYKPPTGSNIHLEFDYPSTWSFFQNWDDPNFIILNFGDPRFRSLPTTYYTPTDFGTIDIWISPVEPGQTSFTELEADKQGYMGEPRHQVITDYMITIDGYDAGVLEYTIGPTEEDYPSVMFNKRIILVVNDQLYEILFRVAEHDRGGEFEQGFEYFFNSLKIVP